MDKFNKMKLTDLFQQLFGNYVNEYKARSNIIVIKYNSGLTISNGEIKKKIENIDKNILYKNHIYRQDIMQEAYEPFLGWIRDIFYQYYDISAEKFLQEAGIYPLMIPMFADYLNNGVFKRKDQRIVSEGEYEKNRLLESIIHILNYISLDHMMIFILEKLHYSEISPLDFIAYMLKQKLHSNLMIVMTYNDSNKPAIHISERYVEMIRLFQKN